MIKEAIRTLEIALFGEIALVIFVMVFVAWTVWAGGAFDWASRGDVVTARATKMASAAGNSCHGADTAPLISLAPFTSPSATHSRSQRGNEAEKRIFKEK